jgi:hypothetical protein
MILIYGWLHHKNRIGLEKLLSYLGYIYIFSNDLSMIDKCDIIYSPSNIIDIEKYKNKKFIFGPHCAIFPDENIKKIINNDNCIYIQPSDWVKVSWQNIIDFPNLKTFPFPVDTEKFSEINSIDKRTLIFIYFKHRNPSDLKYIYDFLSDKNIKPIIISYDRKYSEELYLKVLQNSKYGIVIDAHESQGFAIEEALSTNVPLLVWNVKKMSEEYGSTYPDIPSTTIPYWDNRCGEYFYDKNDFINVFEKFNNKLGQYKPREYILENLSIEQCAKSFKLIL